MTEAETLHTRLDELLKERLGGNFKICKTANGKPYIEGDPLFFSISDSGGLGAIAISTIPVGVDIEALRGKERKSIIRTFSLREQGEICCEADFLKHWTAREAYVKLYGLTLAGTWRHMEFFEENLYIDGEKQPIKYSGYKLEHGFLSIVTGDKL